MKKKILSYGLLGSILGVGTISPLLTSCTINRNEFHILSINDIHGAIPGYGEDLVSVSEKNPGCLRMQKEISKVMKQYPGSIFVSAGDENSGESWSSCDHAYTTYPVLKAMGCRYAAVGNHAFEWDIDDIAAEKYDRLARTDETEGHYFVSSNILNTNLYNTKNWCIDENNPQYVTDYKTWNNQRVSWADPYKLVKMGSYDICLIGLGTKKTLIDGNRKFTSQLSFIDYNASVHYTKQLIKDEKGQKQFDKIKSFILLTHIDSSYDNDILTGEAPDLASTIDTDIDAIISGHSHKAGSGKIWNNKLNKSICVGQAGTAGRNILDTKLVFNTETKKLNSIDMSLISFKPFSKDKFAEAQAEWNNLINNPTQDIAAVAAAYKQQKEVVRSLMSEKIGEVNLTKEEMQPVDDVEQGEFSGYYNTVTATTQTKSVGHEYIDVPDIVDHFSAWINRAIILGFDMMYWDEIDAGIYQAPSIAFLGLDSAPTDLKSGDILVRDTFDQQPHDNNVVLGYLSIEQLASFLNYNLAGMPDGPNVGFNYEKPNWYLADPMQYAYYDVSQDKVISTQISDYKKDGDHIATESYYVNAIEGWWGVKAKLVEISAQERDYQIDDGPTGKSYPLYDPTAKYRISYSPQSVTIDGKTTEVVLPDLYVFDCSSNNFNDIDDPASDAWKPASYWYEQEHNPNPAARKLIPVVVNSFAYDGGNGQTRMLKQYMQWNSLTVSSKFEPVVESRYIRELIEMFIRNSTPDCHEWSEFEVPTDITWQNVSKQIEK